MILIKTCFSHESDGRQQIQRDGKFVYNNIISHSILENGSNFENGRS